MEGAVFDIFSGAPRDNPIWLESAIGLSNARERMEEIATEIQGRYFLSSIGTHSPIAEITSLESSQLLEFAHSTPNAPSGCC